MFLMVYLYWTTRFLHKINSFATKIKNTQNRWDTCRKIIF